MRLCRLDLTRFGIFTDRVIDFGEPVAGRPDLHIVYGPNESGKSTALAGFLDLLFAFEHRSAYSFMHGYSAMQVEADLQFGDDIHRFIRVRKRQGSLVDESGTTVSDDVITNALGGMNRETYKAMFSLDDDTLEAGGEEILNSEGDLGRLLFATGAGLVELSRTLNRLRDTAQSFHRAKSRSTHLNDLKTRIKGIEDEKKRLDTAVSTYARLVTEFDRATAAYNDAMTSRAKFHASREQARRRIEGLGQLAEIRPWRTELAALASLPEVPQVWFTEIGNLITEEPKLSERLDGLRDQERKLIEERDALTFDEAILEIADHLDQLDMGRARYVTAKEDLPSRRASLAETQGTITAIVRRLNMPPGTDPASLAIPAGSVGVLHDLIERHSGIEARLKAAANEMDTAKAVVNTTTENFKLLSGTGADDEAAFERLSNTLEAIQADDSVTRLALHIKQCKRLRAVLVAQVEQLHPWDRDAEELKGVRVPEAEELEEWHSILGNAGKDIERIEHDKLRILATRNRLAALKGRQDNETAVVGDEEAARLRALRDDAWIHHRAALDVDSAVRFEKRLKEDDVVTAGRIANAIGLAGLRKTTEELKSTEAETERSDAQLALARKRRRRALDRVASAVSVMCGTGADNLSPDISLSKLTGWIERRSEILDTLSEMDRENVEISRTRMNSDQCRQRLRDALKAVGLTHEPAVNLEELILAARRAVASDGKRRATLTVARQRVDQSRIEFERRIQEARHAKDDKSKWHDGWTDALSQCWLGRNDPAPSPPAVTRILHEVAALESTLEKRSAMSDRVQRMEEDQASYSSEVQSLLHQLGDVFDAEHPVAQGDGLNGRLAAAKANRTARNGLNTKIDDISEQIAVVERCLTEHRSVSNELLEAFSVDTLQAADEQLQRVARRKTIRNDLARREARLVKSMNAESLEAAEEDLQEVDNEDLQREIAETEARLDDVAGRTQELYHTLESAREALNAIGGDNAIVRLEEERRTCLLEIQERACDYVRIQLGVDAAERALRTYRDEHRTSMMESASQAFRTISRGTYSRLDTQLTDKGEVLLGITAGGNTKIASQMSKGARFQLYLALRLAGYREFVGLHGPVPFIADDILETFDDFRAEETFHLFAEMAEVGQVVYLSHHRHLCDIAKDVCPDVKIHELPVPSAPGGALRNVEKLT